MWLTSKQKAEQFGRDHSVVSRHVRRALVDDQLSTESTMQKMHIAGSAEPVVVYDLDAVISVSYRVNSTHGTQTRSSANMVIGC